MQHITTNSRMDPPRTLTMESYSLRPYSCIRPHSYIYDSIVNVFSESDRKCTLAYDGHTDIFYLFNGAELKIIDCYQQTCQIFESPVLLNNGRLTKSRTYGLTSVIVHDKLHIVGFWEHIIFDIETRGVADFSN